jgi:CCR4-NOT transcription complex subunit 7/8
MYAQDSIELLTNSGIDFKKHEEKGIDVQTFGELLMSSGIVLSEDVRWISFHSAYDFGYLIKLITNNQLPESEDEFFELLHTYFPYVYDIKYLMKSCETLKGGLNQLADDLKITRIGPAHQAGSDSLLTMHTFFKMMQMFFENNFDDEKYIGVLYGIGKGFHGNGSVVDSTPSTPQIQYNAFNPQQSNVINEHTVSKEYFPSNGTYYSMT